MDGALPIVLLVSIGFLVNLLLEGSLVSLLLRRPGKRPIDPGFRALREQRPPGARSLPDSRPAASASLPALATREPSATSVASNRTEALSLTMDTAIPVTRNTSTNREDRP